MGGVKTVKREEEKKSIFQAYQTEIYRIGWRLQYKAKKIRNHEFTYEDAVLNHSSLQTNFTTQAENRILVNELIGGLPPKGRLILHKLYIQDQTEAEVSKELNLSQQAVNKWKRKMIQQLSQTVNL